MPLFNYKARSTSGDLVEGSMEVADRAAAVAQQQHRNFIGIECDPLTHALGSAYVSPHRN